MNPYAPHTPADITAMLEVIGLDSLEGLVAQVPATLRERARIALPDGLSESELRDRLADLAGGDGAARGVPCFAGAGAYPHAIPTVVDHVVRRAEFATAYTPYQPEVSQGTLQAIYEFQTFAALLLGLDVANASMYDGASATAEAVLMARRVVGARPTVLVARALHPHYRAVLRTYLQGIDGLAVEEIPLAADGRTDLDALRGRVDAGTLCVVLGYPNVFGILEDVAAAAGIAHAAGALLVTATTEPLALALARPPGASGADIAVAEGQSFGLPMSYGGPGVGLFATRETHVRALPGRLVGETVDERGRRGFVLTLATREQHIRRERATSNICTNQGLCALAVSVYLSVLGRHGLRRLAETNYAAAHGVADALEARGVSRPFAAPFFNEFVVRVPDATAWVDMVTREAGLIPGVSLGRWYPELPDALLVCVTEVHGVAATDRLVALVAERAGR